MREQEALPARAAEFRDNIDVTIGIGERLGCKAFNALYGNRVDGSSAEEQDELGAENLRLAARAAARIGGTVLVDQPCQDPPRGVPLLTGRVEILDQHPLDMRLELLQTASGPDRRLPRRRDCGL